MSKPDVSTLPAYEQHYFCKWLVEATIAFFENPENKRDFEIWLAEKNAAKENV